MKKIIFIIFISIGFLLFYNADKTIIDEWNTVKIPAVPALTEVKIEPATTALLILDIQNGSCNESARPRCVATIASIKKLLVQARAKKMLVVYSITGSGKPEDIVKDVAPLSGDPIVQSSVDKFYKTDLEKILTDKGIKNVIITGTASNGAVLYTAAGAVVRNLKVIIPVDGMSGDDAYTDQYVAFHMINSPGTKKNAVLTKADLIKF